MQSAEKLLARGEVYNFLSRAYCFPEGSSLKDCCSGAVRDAFCVLELPLLARELENMSAYLQANTEPLELSVEYTRLFRGPVKAEVYPYESMHVDGEIMGESALDVVRRYHEAGVEMSPEFKDLPDHISAELDFMHYLCGQELDALQRGGSDEATRFQHMRLAFLKDHLDKWVPSMCEKIRESGTTRFYGSLADLTEGWIRYDQA